MEMQQDQQDSFRLMQSEGDKKDKDDKRENECKDCIKVPEK